MEWQPLKINRRVNIPAETRLKQLHENIQRDLPWFSGRPAHKRKLVVAAGGPSISGYYDQIRKRIKKADLWAVNSSYMGLMDKGIIADAVVLLDASPRIAPFVEKWHPKTTFYVASQCHHSVFDNLDGANIILWHAMGEGVEEAVKGIEDKPVAVIHGGSVVGLKTMFLAYLLGYRTIDYYGLDGSITDRLYAFTDVKSKDPIIDVKFYGREFRTYPIFAQSANEFLQQMKMLPDMKIRAHGDTLIPHICKTVTQLRQSGETNEPNKRRCINRATAHQ